MLARDLSFDKAVVECLQLIKRTRHGIYLYAYISRLDNIKRMITRPKYTAPLGKLQMHSECG